MAILTCRDMSFAYDGKTVLEGVNFSLSAGDYLCVVGENGSGKSTLIKGLLGLKAPASGELILLARALCATKKLLLLDEPVTGLDPIAAGEMYNLIKLVNLCDGISVIMVSHDIHEAVRYATHILHLGHRQLFFGTAAEYRESDLARRFLGGNRV